MGINLSNILIIIIKRTDKKIQTMKSFYQKNTKSLSLIQSNKVDLAITLLKKTLQDLSNYLQDNPQQQTQCVQLRIVTLNNLACAYSKKQKYNQSLQILQQVQNIQNNQKRTTPFNKLTFKELNQLASTHSNLGAAYSRIHKHQQALSSIQEAMFLYESSMKFINDPCTYDKTINGLIVSYYNCAIQNEYLNNMIDSSRIIQKAFQLIIKYECKANRPLLKLIKQAKQRIHQRINLRRIKMQHNKNKFVMNTDTNTSPSNKVRSKDKLSTTICRNTLSSVTKTNIPNIRKSSLIKHRQIIKSQGRRSNLLNCYFENKTEKINSQTIFLPQNKPNYTIYSRKFSEIY